MPILKIALFAVIVIPVTVITIPVRICWDAIRFGWEVGDDVVYWMRH